MASGVSATRNGRDWLLDTCYVCVKEEKGIVAASLCDACVNDNEKKVEDSLVSSMMISAGNFVF